MHLDFFTVFSNVLGLFVLIGVGFAALRLRILPEESRTVFTKLLMSISLPCTLFVSMADREYDPAFTLFYLVVLVSGFIILLGAFLLCLPLFRLNLVKKGNRGVWLFNTMSSNAAFMGFPIVLALFGKDAVSLAAMYVIAINIIQFTMGVELIIRDTGVKRTGSVIAPFINPVNISIVVSLVFYFGRIPVPEAVFQPIRYLSNLTTPLSMVLTGIILGSQKEMNLFGDREVWLCTILRLAVIPLLTLLVIRNIPFPHPLIYPVLSIITAMPCAAVGTVLAEQYHANRDLSAKNVFVTSLLSIVTIPLFCMLL